MENCLAMRIGIARANRHCNALQNKPPPRHCEIRAMPESWQSICESSLRENERSEVSIFKVFATFRHCEKMSVANFRGNPKKRKSVLLRHLQRLAMTNPPTHCDDFRPKQSKAIHESPFLQKSYKFLIKLPNYFSF